MTTDKRQMIAWPRLPFRIVIEPRLHVPRWLAPLVSLGAVVVALIIGGIVIQASGGHPIESYLHIFKAAHRAAELKGGKGGKP